MPQESGYTGTDTSQVNNPDQPLFGANAPTYKPPEGTILSQRTETRADGSVWSITVTADGQGGTRTQSVMIQGATTPAKPATQPTAPTTPAAPTAPAPAAAVPGAPPAGANPDEQEIVYENGRPVRSVYKYTANGHTAGQVIRDYSSLWAKADTVQTAPDFATWQAQNAPGFQSDVTGSTPYQGMAALIAKLNDPNTTIADRNMALDQLAKERGYASGQEYNAAMNAWGTKLEGGPASMQGMSEEEKAAYQRVANAQLQDLQTQQRKQLDSIMSGQTGNSTARSLMAANENIKTIRDAQLQSTVSLMNMDYTRKLDEFDRNMQLYKDQMDRGEMTTQQFMQSFKENRLSALQGFATQTATILQQNQQYLNMYSADIEKIRTNADIVFQSISVELGVDEAAQTALRDSFDKWAASEGLRLTQLQMEANQQQDQMKTVMGALMLVGGIISIFIPGGQTLGGALITGGAAALGA